MKQSESLDFLCTLPALKKTNVCFLLSSSNPISQRDKERKYKDTLTYLQKHKHTQQPEPTTQKCFYFTSPFNKKKFHKFKKKKKKMQEFLEFKFSVVFLTLRLHIHIDSCLDR